MQSLQRKKYLIIAALLCVLVASACGGYAYKSNPLETPLFQEHGDGDMTISTQLPLISANFQGGHAMSERFGWIGGASIGAGYWFGEFGIGPFWKLSDRTSIELFGGFGLGHNRVTGEQDEGWYHSAGERGSSSVTRFRRYFAQADLGFTEAERRIALAVRASYLDVYAYHRTYDSVAVSTLTPDLRDPQRVFFLEPALSLKFGEKNQWDIQVGYIIPFNKQTSHGRPPMRRSDGHKNSSSHLTDLAWPPVNIS